MARSVLAFEHAPYLLAGFERRSGRGLRDRKLAQHLARRGDAEVVLDAHVVDPERGFVRHVNSPAGLPRGSPARLPAAAPGTPAKGVRPSPSRGL